MSKDFGQGIFTMDFITEISKMKDLTEAKKMVTAVIDLSTANDENVEKAHALVAKARSIHNLIFSMTDFSLSHQGLKVIK